MLAVFPGIILWARRSLKIYAKDSQWDVPRSVVYNFERSIIWTGYLIKF